MVIVFKVIGIFICDKCNHQIEIHRKTKKLCLLELRKQGWTKSQYGYYYSIKCPRCKYKHWDNRVDNGRSRNNMTRE